MRRMTWRAISIRPSAKVALNVSMDACFVPSATGGGGEGARQGLTLVHFPAQLERFV